MVARTLAAGWPQSAWFLLLFVAVFLLAGSPLGGSASSPTNESPLSPLATTTAVFLSASAPTLIALPARTVTLAPVQSTPTFVLAAEAWQGKSWSEIVDHSTALASTSATISCSGTGSSGRPSPELLGSQAPALLELTGNVTLAVRGVRFVGCSRIFRIRDQTELNLLTVGFEFAWRILVATQQSSARLTSVAVTNSTISYDDALSAWSSELAANGNLSTEFRCGSIPLLCLLDTATLYGRNITAQQIGIAGGQPVQRFQQFRDSTSFNAIIYGEDAGRFAVLDTMLSGSFANLGDASFANLTQLMVSGARAELGGAVVARGSSRLLCAACIFKNNSAAYSGGAIASMAQAAVRLSAGTLFTENQAFFGGALWLQDRAILHVAESVSFLNGAAVSSGAGIFLAMNASANLNGAAASGNVAQDVGGFLVACDSSTAFLFNNSLIKSNMALLSGGGISIYSNASLSLLESSCVSNRANVFGGCIRNQGGRVSLRGGLHRLNFATRGGVFYSLYGSIRLDGAVFDSNFVRNDLSSRYANAYGGCGYADSAEVAVSDSLFTNNSALDFIPSSSANGRGGALQVYLSVLTVSSSTFTQNYADYMAGAILVEKSTMNGTDINFSENIASIFSPEFQRASQAQSGTPDEMNASGGGLAVIGSALRLLSSSFIGNYGDYLGGGVAIDTSFAEIRETLFLNNTGVYGGAVLAYGNGSLVMHGGICTGNQARIGACAHCEQNVTVSMSAMKISANRADKSVNQGIEVLYLRVSPSSYGGGIRLVFFCSYSV
jgi:hypothetical protein